MSRRADGSPAPGEIPFLLAEPERSVDRAPMGTRVGCITLGAWLVSRIQRMPESLGGHDGYLIKVAYDFDIEPDAAVPSWFEVAFTFAADGVPVHDALPALAGERRPHRHEGEVRTAGARQATKASGLRIERVPQWLRETAGTLAFMSRFQLLSTPSSPGRDSRETP